MGATFDAPGALREGWRITTSHPIPVIVGVFLAWIGSGGGGGSGGGDWEDAAWPSMLETASPEEIVALVVSAVAVLGVIFAVFLCIEVFLFLVRAFGNPGWLRWLRGATLGRDDGLGVLVSGSDRMVDFALWRILRWLLVAAATFVAALPGVLVGMIAATGSSVGLGLVLAGALSGPLAFVVWLYLHARLLLGDVLVVHDGLDPMSTLREAWAATDDTAMSALLYVVLMGLAGFGAFVVGVLTCCVGLLFTLPLWACCYDIGRVRAWQALRGEVTPAG